VAREAVAFREVEIYACQDSADALDGTVSREEEVAAEYRAARLDALKDCEGEFCWTAEEWGPCRNAAGTPNRLAPEKRLSLRKEGASRRSLAVTEGATQVMVWSPTRRRGSSGPHSAGYSAKSCVPRPDSSRIHRALLESASTHETRPGRSVPSLRGRPDRGVGQGSRARRRPAKLEAAIMNEERFGANEGHGTPPPAANTRRNGHELVVLDDALSELARIGAEGVSGVRVVSAEVEEREAVRLAVECGKSPSEPRPMSELVEEVCDKAKANIGQRLSTEGQPEGERSGAVE
jgi:hypothetical protein